MTHPFKQALPGTEMTKNRKRMRQMLLPLTLTHNTLNLYFEEQLTSKDYNVYNRSVSSRLVSGDSLILKFQFVKL